MHQVVINVIDITGFSFQIYCVKEFCLMYSVLGDFICSFYMFLCAISSMCFWDIIIFISNWTLNQVLHSETYVTVMAVIVGNFKNYIWSFVFGSLVFELCVQFVEY